MELRTAENKHLTDCDLSVTEISTKIKKILKLYMEFIQNDSNYG